MAKRATIKTSHAATSRDEVERLLLDLGEIQRRRELIKLALDESISAARATAADEDAPLKIREESAVAAIQAWAEVNRPSLTADGLKTVPLANGVIGWRTGMPTVAIKRGTDLPDLLRRLIDRGLSVFVRHAPDLDKEAILRADDTDLSRLRYVAPEIAISQIERFFVEPKGAAQ